MRRILFIIIAIAIALLFIIPESAMSEYKGLISVKYFLQDSAIKAKSIISSLIRGERPKEFDILGDKAKEKLEQGKKDAMEGAKGIFKEGAKDVIDGL